MDGESALVTKSLNSSWLMEATYNKDTQSLDVRTVHGKSYTLTGVPPDEFENFVTADSPGNYFNERLKGNY